MAAVDDDKRRRQADDCLHTRIAVLEERIKGRDDALALQAREYERRLQDLNHAHALASEKNAEYLPRSVYEKSEDERGIWQRKVDSTLDTAGGKIAAYISVVAFLMAAAAMAIAFFR